MSVTCKKRSKTSFKCHHIHKHRLTAKKMFSYRLWSPIGHSDKTSKAAAGDSGSGKRHNSGAYKIEGVIY